MPTMTGVVEKIFEKGGRYSFVIDEKWYSTYRTKPSCNEGDTISFEYVVKGNFQNADPATIEVVSATAPAKVESSGANRQDTISYQAARKDALVFAQMAVEVGAIKLPTKQDEKYDALMGIVLELTDEFFEGTATLGQNTINAAVEAETKNWGAE